MRSELRVRSAKWEWKFFCFSAHYDCVRGRHLKCPPLPPDWVWTQFAFGLFSFLRVKCSRRKRHLKCPPFPLIRLCRHHQNCQDRRIFYSYPLFNADVLPLAKPLIASWNNFIIFLGLSFIFSFVCLGDEFAAFNLFHCLPSFHRYHRWGVV